MQAQVGIVMDMSADLPDDFVTRHGIRILPAVVRAGGREEVHGRRPEQTAQFYAARLGEAAAADAETVPLSVPETARFLVEDVAAETETAILITMAATRSRMHEVLTEALPGAMRQVRALPPSVRGPRRFHGIVLDSGSLFTGPGLLAYEAVRLRGLGLTLGDIRTRLQQFIPQVHAYLIPQDLGYLRQRGTRRGDRTVGTVSFLMAQAFDIRPILAANQNHTEPVAKGRHFEQTAEKLFAHAVRQIHAGVSISALNISYGGDVRMVGRLPGFRELQITAKQHRVEVLISTMSVGAAVNVGPEGLSLAYATPSPIGWG